MAAVCIWGYRHGKVGFDSYDLFLYQREKMRAPGPVDTVFVGDSSLGNAIDARVWSELTGRPARNLALTGAFGYGGTLNMARQSVGRHRPREIIIMQTPEMLTRSGGLLGYLHTLDRLPSLNEVPLSVLLEAYVNLDTVIAVAGRVLRASEPRHLDARLYDFVKQGRPLAEIPGFAQRYGSEVLRREQLNAGHLPFLERIAALCRAERIRCTYAHGPILESYCANSARYFEEANAMIESTGLRVLPGTPICMPLSDAGDTQDHVRLERRPSYTAKYLELMGRDAPR